VSQENVELVLRLNDAATRGHVNEMEIRSFFHPDVEFPPRRSVTEGLQCLRAMERHRAGHREDIREVRSHSLSFDLGASGWVAWGNDPCSKGDKVPSSIAHLNGRGVFEFRDGEDRAL